MPTDAEQISSDFKGDHLSLSMFGCKGDGQAVFDGAMTASGHNLTSTTGGWAAGDVGKLVSIEGAGTSGDPLVTTIATFVSATHVTTTAAAVGTVSGAYVVWGTDNSVSLAGAFAASNGMSLLIPVGRFLFATPLVVGLPTTGEGWRLHGNNSGSGSNSSTIEYVGTGTALTILDARYVVLEKFRLNAWNGNGINLKVSASPEFSVNHHLQSIHVRGAQTPKAGSIGVQLQIANHTGPPANYFHQLNHVDLYGWETCIDIDADCNGAHILFPICSNFSKYGIRVNCAESRIDTPYFNSSSGVDDAHAIICLFIDSSAVDNQITGVMADPGPHSIAYKIVAGATRNEIVCIDDQCTLPPVVNEYRGLIHGWDRLFQYGPIQLLLSQRTLVDTPIENYFDQSNTFWAARNLDTITVLDAAMTATSHDLNAASAAFAATDVGKFIVVRGAGTTGTLNALVSTIATRVSATHITLTDAAVNTVSNAPTTYGWGQLKFYGGRQGGVPALIADDQGVCLPGYSRFTDATGKTFLAELVVPDATTGNLKIYAGKNGGQAAQILDNSGTNVTLGQYMRFSDATGATFMGEIVCTDGTTGIIKFFGGKNGGSPAFLIDSGGTLVMEGVYVRFVDSSGATFCGQIICPSSSTGDVKIYGGKNGGNPALVADNGGVRILGYAQFKTLNDVTFLGEILCDQTSGDMKLYATKNGSHEALHLVGGLGKGAIYATDANGTATALSPGANGDVLTADSSQTLGLSWTTPGGGSYPSLTSLTSACNSALTMTTSYADVANTSISLTAGTWIVTGVFHFALSGTGEGEVYGGLNVNGSLQAGLATAALSASGDLSGSQVWVVTVGSTQTAKLQAKKSNAGGSAFVIDVNSTITALRIA